MKRGILFDVKIPNDELKSRIENDTNTQETKELFIDR
jgi:hypothetical protein